jgi:hypothetical protein
MVRKRQYVGPFHHVQNYTCRVTLLQPARRAAELDQPSSLRPYWGHPPPPVRANVGIEVERLREGEGVISHGTGAGRTQTYMIGQHKNLIDYFAHRKCTENKLLIFSRPIFERETAVHLAPKLALAREHRGGGEDSGGDAGHGGEREHLPHARRLVLPRGREEMYR